MDLDLSSVIKPLVKEIIDVARLQAKQEVYPLEIRGNLLASKLIGITANTLNQRLHRGFYKEGYHFTKKSDRIFIWDRDALLESEQL